MNRHRELERSVHNLNITHPQSKHSLQTKLNNFKKVVCYCVSTSKYIITCILHYFYIDRHHKHYHMLVEKSQFKSHKHAHKHLTLTRLTRITQVRQFDGIACSFTHDRHLIYWKCITWGKHKVIHNMQGDRE